MVEQIVNDGVGLATILRASTVVEGIRFYTDSDATLQVGHMKRPLGYVITPHVHRPVERSVSYTQEVLFIKQGRVRVDFYDEQQRFLESRELGAGDVVLLARGGHGFVMLDECEIIEVKQGPYVGESDKARFPGITTAAAKDQKQS
jgi:mannose-6-phosphate isomerase-like protein (cupin superfamily)